MTRWTDDELATLLTDTFRSREALADPGTAVRLARAAGPRRRQWPLVLATAAAVAALVGGVTVLAVQPPHDGDVAGPAEPSPTEPSPAASTTASAGRTDADNAAAAAAESRRVLRLAPLPPGAKRIPGRPAGWPVGAAVGVGPSDAALTRTAWFTVPGSADRVQTFLEHHLPTGMSIGDGLGESEGVRNLDYTTGSRRPSAYTAPTLTVQWYDLGSRTALRFDSVLASRRARTAATYVTGAVTSVDIDRTVSQAMGARRRVPTLRLEVGTDPERLDRLVTVLNGLHGALRHPVLAYCPAILKTTRYRLTFDTSGGRVAFVWVASTCSSGVTVTRDGRAVGPALDPGELGQTLDAVLGDSSRQ